MFGASAGNLIYWALILVVVAGLLGAAYWWRDLLRGMNDLPMWKFLGKRECRRADLEAKDGATKVKHAELRCAMCAGREDCGTRIALGDPPLEHCPNKEMFKDYWRAAFLSITPHV